MSVTISLSALVCMACLFTPKVSDPIQFIEKRDKKCTYRTIFTHYPQLCHRVIAALHYTGATRTERSKEYDGGQSLQKWIDKARRHRAIFHDEHCDGDDVDMQSEGKAPATNVDCRR